MTESLIAWRNLPQFIGPLLRRHTEDTAFYWTLMDGGADAATWPARRVAYAQKLIEAHLEGLRVAGVDGLVLTADALTRWRKPGEAFAAFVGTLALPPSDLQGHPVEPLLAVVRQSPDLLLRGLISALAWLNEEQAEPWLARGLASDDSLWRVAALRACTLRGLGVTRWQDHATDANPHVRAAACRAAGPDQLPSLLAMRIDDDLQVRAEAVIAWSRCLPEPDRPADSGRQAASDLWRCVSVQLGWMASRTGWNRVQAQRRLDRWLRHLAWLAPVGHPGIPQLLAQLPPALALRFSLYHGDLAHLGHVLEVMRQPAHARWALWVWRSLTGVDPAAHGLTLPNPPVDLDAPLSDDQRAADQGLARPDVDAVAAHPAPSLELEPGTRVLMGQPVKARWLRTLLDPDSNQPQALRFVAAHALAQLHPEFALQLRASPQTQAEQLTRMGVQ